MGNPYHDERGQYCSKGEMQKAIQRTAAAGNYSEMWKLKDSMKAIENGTAPVQQAIKPVGTIRERRAKAFHDRNFAAPEQLDKRTASKDRNTAPELLTKMATDKSAITRIGVASNTSTPVATLTKLSKDKDWGVRAAVSKNTATPLTVLRELAKDDNSWVTDGLKDNPSYRP